MIKLLSKDLKIYRYLQWIKQEKMCPLCKEEISEREVVLDHDHSSGHCRQVLHNGCNRIEGKIKNSFARFMSNRDISFLDFFKNLSEYVELDYSDNPIHPTELTPLERELKIVNKKLKSLKRESTVAEYKARAKELRLLIKEDRKVNSWNPD